MTPSLEQFVQQVVSSGLLSTAELQAVQSRLSSEDAATLGEELTRLGLLTAYQVQRCLAGDAANLSLGNYLVLDELGRGGMGVVYKAIHRRMERTVALKVLSPAVAGSPDLAARFHREVKAAARLSHPNIVRAYDADETNGTVFLVMEYVEGEDLATVVRRHGVLSVDRAVEYLLQAARGLDYAHRSGVVHRDIKPANLLRDRDGTVRILDMGLARMEDEAGQKTGPESHLPSDARSTEVDASPSVSARAFR